MTVAFMRLRFCASALLMAMCVAAAADPQEDPARAVLDQAAAALSGLQSVHLQATITYIAKYDGSEETMDTHYDLSTNRDGDLAIHIANDNIGIELFATGDEVVRYMPEFNQYIRQPREESVAQILERASFEIIDPVVTVLASIAQFKSPAEGLVVRDLALVGQEDVGGKPCDRVHFSIGGTAYDLWIEKAPVRVIRRIQPDMSAIEEQYKTEYDMEFDISLVADITTWEPGADVVALAKFTAPDGAEEVTRFGRKTPAELMVGQPAPDFTLPLLNGGSFTLSDQKGKIVLLDFWATWCGPCRMGMPALAEVAKDFADKGIVLVGVNLGDDPAEIRAFLESMGLDIQVALETEGRVAEAYGVNPIPQTTIIGPDGIIHTVHIGLWAMPDESMQSSATTQEEMVAQFHKLLADELRKELQAIIDEYVKK